MPKLAQSTPTRERIAQAFETAPIGTELKTIISEADTALNETFVEHSKNNNAPIELLVAQRSNLVDLLLRQTWQALFEESRDICLCAVGGYGRGELHLKSDVDIMILASDTLIKEKKDPIEKFIALLWDTGLDVGHSVRTLQDVKTESAQDITIATNIMEARLLCGDHVLFAELQSYTQSHEDWTLQDFVQAKFEEQEARYHKFNDDGYRVEPNIKYGPGGLRDIQNIEWVAKRIYGPQKTIFELDFLTEQEKTQLKNYRNLLWKIRWGLHYISEHNENRLLFDLQKRLATLFGFSSEGTQSNEGVEAFMQRYHRAVIGLERLNEMLLQLLREPLLHSADTPITPVNERFQIRNNYLEAINPNIFQTQPNALLEVFQLMQKNSELSGVSATTIRAIRQYRDLIDDNFRQNPVNQQAFMSLMNQEVGVTREFRRMNRYGILARYIPEFANLVGLMQFDLFHIYTVDQHTIAVLGQTRTYVTPEGREKFPKASEIYDQLEDPTLLHVAAIFHDMGKGCGGDHSIVGEKMVNNFCRLHNFKKSDRKLCAWLVRQHLIMSYTSQRKDISDPDEIQEFAKQVGDQKHLDYLYLLTIADINGTNPSLWNNWRKSLLEELYSRTSRALRRGQAKPSGANEIIKERKERCLEWLEYADIDQPEIDDLWAQLPDEYFLRHSSDEIAWQTQSIIKSGIDSLPLVDIKPRSKRGGTTILIYSDDCPNLFAHAAITLDKLGLNVVDARIITTTPGKNIDTFIVLDDDDKPIENKLQKLHIINKLCNTVKNAHDIKNPPTPTIIEQRIPRQLKAMSVPTQIQASSSPDHQHTVIEVITTDRPGILAHMGCAFIECDVSVVNAKINTLGERVDDVFFITEKTGGALSNPKRIQQIIDKLYQHIDTHNA